ncbi:MAG: HD domain-containing protein [Candidatus Thorarchaeota archaeon]
MIVRDPVFGDIYFTETERKIIDTPEIQRLRGIKQLGTAYLVYPGATHTRFDHSLGTSSLTKRIIQTIRYNDYDINKDTEELISIAGLVHDISHVPFGHTFEDERRIFEKHDKVENFRKDLSRGKLGEILNELGIKEKLIKLLSSSDPTMKQYGSPWMSQIINDTICADLLDYIRRDCYHTGINKDYDDRVFSYFIIDDEKLVLNFVKNKMERSDARSEILHLLRLRYFLTERIYFHHAKLSSGAMISKAVELAMKENLLSRDILYQLNDWTLFDFLKGFPKKRSENNPIRKLIERVEGRQLLKRAYVLSSASLSSRKSRDEFIKRFNPPTPEREQIEDMIINRLQKSTGNNAIDKSDVIIHCLSGTSLKEAEVLIKNVHGELTQLNSRPHPAADVKSIEDSYEDLWRMYVFAHEKYAADVGKICEETFGRKNEYSPKK